MQYIAPPELPLGMLYQVSFAILADHMGACDTFLRNHAKTLEKQRFELCSAAELKPYKTNGK